MPPLQLLSLLYKAHFISMTIGANSEAKGNENADRSTVSRLVADDRTVGIFMGKPEKTNAAAGVYTELTKPPITETEYGTMVLSTVGVIGDTNIFYVYVVERPLHDAWRRNALMEVLETRSDGEIWVNQDAFARVFQPPRAL